jgi:Osmosensitive K+ channel histidine kinase
VLLAVVLLPLLTVVLATARAHLNLADFVLVYLVAVVAITVIGGFWPAVLAAVAASLLLNWYFTVPIHTFTIAQPRELLALLLFVTVAVAVSSVVHLAARRARRPPGPGRRRPRCSSWHRTCWAAPTPPRPCSSTSPGPTAARPSCRNGWPAGGCGPPQADSMACWRRPTGSTSATT